MESSEKLIVLNNDEKHPIFLIAKVKNRKPIYNICDENLHILSDIWFKHITMFNKHNLAIVVNQSNKENIINKEGKLLLDKFYNSAYIINSYDDEEYMFKIKDDNNLYNYVNKDGKFLSKEWLQYAKGFGKNGFAPIKEANGRDNLMDKNGNLLLNDNRFDGIFIISSDINDLFIVKKNNKKSIVDKNLNLINKDMWLDSIFSHVNIFNNILFVVTLNGKFNFIDKKGNIISKIWFDYAFSQNKSKKYIVVYKNGKYNIMNIEGKLVFRGKWFDCNQFYTPFDVSEDVICIQNKNSNIFHAYNMDKIEKGIINS